MITIQEYLLSKTKKGNIIHATNDTIKKIVKDELDILGHYADLNHIDVSEVTNMDSLFSCSVEDLGTRYKDLNPDISQWNVSKVQNTSCMFYKCKNFCCDISRWDVSNVKDMSGMFYNCEKFDQDLSQWNVSKVTNMHSVFNGCETFNQDLSKWNVSNVENMWYMFYGCKNFNQDLSHWDINKVKNHALMFDECPIKEEWKPKFKD